MKRASLERIWPGIVCDEFGSVRASVCVEKRVYDRQGQSSEGGNRKWRWLTCSEDGKGRNGVAFLGRNGEDGFTAYEERIFVRTWSLESSRRDQGRGEGGVRLADDNRYFSRREECV